jgi:hypothetical protein
VHLLHPPPLLVFSRRCAGTSPALSAPVRPPTDHDDDPQSIAVRQLIVGIFLVVIGVLVTAVTYGASHGSSEYALAVGPIVIGAIAAIRGFVGMFQSPP